MRLALAAMTAEKGGLEQNLERHVDILHEAARDGCDLAVFPEFSLTGSVDPLRTPDRLITIDADAIGAVAAETKAASVAAVFGIGEEATGGPFITQVYARDGTVVGVQRKRHLGEDEGGYSVSADDQTFDIGATRFAIAICAESGVDHPWDAAAAAGVGLVVFCSAPGLYGRREDEAAWRDGCTWWSGCGLAEARQHAARNKFWVAIATQAGSTEDEDFPGLAALVDPNGDVVAQLPDWRPGTLLVEVPTE
jgi:predicted amidohydrolase